MIYIQSIYRVKAGLKIITQYMKKGFKEDLQFGWLQVKQKRNLQKF